MDQKDAADLHESKCIAAVLLVIRERLLRRRQLLLRRRLGVFETGLLRGRLRHPLLHRRDLHLQILLEHLIPNTRSTAPSGPRLHLGGVEGKANSLHIDFLAALRTTFNGTAKEDTTY